MTPHPKTGGRTARFTTDDVVAAGVRAGLADLTVQRVASALGVTSAAIYRHVPNRLALERLVGEAILDRLTIADDPEQSTRDYLLSFAAQLRRFTLAHPGTADYLQGLFPRGAAGARLLEEQIVALGRRGYDAAAATALGSATAFLALGVVITEEARAARAAAEPADSEAEIQEALAVLGRSPVLRAMLSSIPAVTPDEYFHVLLTAVVDGLLLHLPPGRPVAALIPHAPAGAVGGEEA